MRHKDPYDRLAGGKQQGEPLLTGGEQRGSQATADKEGRAEQHPPRPAPASQPVPFRTVRSSSSASAFHALTVSKTRRC
jgi:hypothetical protein